MDQLSANFLKLHKKKQNKRYSPFVEYNKPRKILNKVDVIKIEVSDLTENNLKKWFALFKQFLLKTESTDIREITEWDFLNFKELTRKCNSIVEYAQDINKTVIPFRLKDDLITKIIIHFSENYKTNIDSLLRGAVKWSKKVFIGTDYAKEFNATSENIKTIIKNWKFNPIKLDEIEHNEIIDNKLYEEMSECDFGVFDISSNNSNVTFEAGYMLGKGKQIILICHQNYFQNVKFDFNHRNIVQFASEEELEEKMEKKLTAIVKEIYI